MTHRSGAHRPALVALGALAVLWAVPAHATGESMTLTVDGVPRTVTIDDFGWQGGAWSISGGALRETTGGPGVPPDLSVWYTGAVVGDGSVSADLTVTGDINGSNYSIGVIGRLADANDYYFVYLGQSGQVAFAQLTGGNWQLLASGSYDALPIGTTRNVRLSFTGAGVDVYTDNVYRYSVLLPSPNWPSGEIGFTSGWGALAQISNIAVVTGNGPTARAPSTWGTIKSSFR